MNQPVDIHKAAAIILQDKKLLVSRAAGKDIFLAPGGKLEAAETPEQALIRELREEEGIEINATDLIPFGTFFALAAGYEAEQLQLQMDVFLVTKFDGTLKPHSEIDENRFIDSNSLDGSIKVG